MLYRAQIGGWALAHRAVATKPAEYFLETHRNIFETHDETFGAGVGDGETYRSDDIFAFHNLVPILYNFFSVTEDEAK